MPLRSTPMLAHLAAGLLVLAPAPAPDELAEPAPTDVTVTWASPAHQDIAVTWRETGARRNQVDLVRADGTPTGAAPITVAADQPDRATWRNAGLGTATLYRFAVRAIDADGNAVSEPGLSPVFDTDAPPAPRITAVVPRVDGTIEMRWTAGAAEDSTPGDPLDLPADDPPRFVPVVATISTGPNRYEDLSAPTTATSFLVPATRTPPLWLRVRLGNEWGVTYSGPVEVVHTRLSAQVPGRATDGESMRVSGTALEVVRACDLAVCFPYERPDANRGVQLQARTGAGAAWQVLATTRTAADGAYRFDVRSPGSREYRVVAPPVRYVPEEPARAFAATEPAATTSAPAAGASASAGGGAGGGLPVTGAPAGVTAALGSVLLALGVLLCAAGRRRS